MPDIARLLRRGPDRLGPTSPLLLIPIAIDRDRDQQQRARWTESVGAAPKEARYVRHQYRVLSEAYLEQSVRITIGKPVRQQRGLSNARARRNEVFLLFAPAPGGCMYFGYRSRFVGWLQV